MPSGPSNTTLLVIELSLGLYRRFSSEIENETNLKYPLKQIYRIFFPRKYSLVIHSLKSMNFIDLPLLREKIQLFFYFFIFIQIQQPEVFAIIRPYELLTFRMNTI